MKKLNFIIGKRQIMISTLLLILAVAAYLNWQFASNDQSISVMDVLNPKKTQNSPQTEKIENNESNYGTAQLVSDEVKNEVKNDYNNKTTDYFTQAKMQKEASRADTMDSLQKTQEMPNISQETKTEAEKQNLNLTNTDNQEKTIESKVKALGFEDCLVYITNQDSNNQDSPDPKVDVMVKTTDQMDVGEAAKIKNIVVDVTKAKPINITVTPVM